MAVHISHVFKDGTRIEGSLQGRGMMMPYNETTELYYKLCADAMWEQMQKEARKERGENSE